MQFRVTATPSADEDLAYFKVFEQRIIVGAIRVHLVSDANIETNRRKRLTDHPLASWELRVGKYRVFYELEEHELEEKGTVKIVAVGHKEHNALFVRGREVEL
jgi:mRNA-degrading endonuclease RelE of RelBE toxin-antitoxin system